MPIVSIYRRIGIDLAEWLYRREQLNVEDSGLAKWQPDQQGAAILLALCIDQQGNTVAILAFPCVAHGARLRQVFDRLDFAPDKFRVQHLPLNGLRMDAEQDQELHKGNSMDLAAALVTHNRAEDRGQFPFAAGFQNGPARRRIGVLITKPLKLLDL